MLHAFYPDLKIFHASFALLTLLLFIWRGRISLRGGEISRRWLRRVPDTVDSALLISGLTLVVLSGQYPWVSDWVAIKLLAVMAYIGLGFVALRFGRSRRQCEVAWFAALGVFFAIVWLAHARHVPWWS